MRPPPIAGQVMAILLLGTVLVMLLLTQRQCARGVSGLVGAFDPPAAQRPDAASLGDAGAAPAAPR